MIFIIYPTIHDLKFRPFYLKVMQPCKNSFIYLRTSSRLTFSSMHSILIKCHLDFPCKKTEANSGDCLKNSAERFTGRQHH